MRTIRTKIYKFSELTEEGQRKAIENLSDINIDHSEWDNSIEDAEQIGLKIISLDDHRANKGEFITNAETCANFILINHGKDCETFKTAKSFLDEYLPLKKAWDENEDNEGFPFEYEDQATDLSEEFLISLLEDYRIMCNKNYEYLTSEEAIIETIEANEYEFFEDGKLIPAKYYAKQDKNWSRYPWFVRMSLRVLTRKGAHNEVYCSADQYGQFHKGL